MKQLRDGNGGSSPTPPRQVKEAAVSEQNETAKSKTRSVDPDSLFQTNDNTLEELLADEDLEPVSAAKDPADDEVTKLLEQLANDVPKGSADDEIMHGDDSDDSDGEAMNNEVDDVIARYRDELEVEKSLLEEEEEEEPKASDEEDDGQETYTSSNMEFPSIPSELGGNDLNASPSSDLNDLQARMASLRLPSVGATDDGLDLPSVPSSRPSGKPVKRLETRTNYTDDDVDSWCTVCLEDATLRCKGCDDDVYCTRCWKEMHLGPSAAFDDRSHKAVQFTKDRKKKEKKIAIGAS